MRGASVGNSGVLVNRIVDSLIKMTLDTLEMCEMCELCFVTMSCTMSMGCEVCEMSLVKTRTRIRVILTASD